MLYANENYINGITRIHHSEDGINTIAKISSIVRRYFLPQFLHNMLDKAYWQYAIKVVLVTALYSLDDNTTNLSNV